MIPALFKAAAALSGFDRERVPFGAVGSEKAVAQAVKAVGLKVRGEELVTVFFIVQIVFDHAIRITAARGIEAHLKVLVVHGHMVEAELQVGENRKTAFTSADVFNVQVPDFHGVVHRDKQGLLGVDAAVVAAVFHIAQSMAAGKVLLRLSDRLPRHRPVIPVFRIAKVHIVPRAIHRYAVWPKARNAVVFRALVNQLAPGRVVENAHHILCADIVCPGDREIHPVDDILALCMIEMSVLHRLPLPSFSILYNDKMKGDRHISASSCQILLY